MVLGMIIPAFNPEVVSLSRAVSSIIEGGRGNNLKIKIFLIDDASSERYSLVYSELIKKYSDEIVFHRMPANVGPGEARNKGLDLAGRYGVDVVGFLDADDSMAEDWYASIKSYLDDETIDVLTAGYTINGKPRGCMPSVSVSSWVGGPFTRISSIFIKRKIFFENRERFIPVRAGEDTEFIIRVILKYYFVHLPCVISCYNCTYKEHFIYPHPLLGLLEKYNDNVDVQKLEKFARKRDEFAGLMTRQILPDGDTVFYKRHQAIAIYVFGKTFRRLWAAYKNIF